MSEVRRLQVWEQVAALHFAETYGSVGPGCASTHRESALWDRLHANGFEIVRVVQSDED